MAMNDGMSPEMDWEAFAISFLSDDDDFQPIISELPILVNDEKSAEIGQCSFTSTAMTTREEDAGDDRKEPEKGVRLIHLLIAAAEALTLSQDLARVILVRLNELVAPPLSSQDGGSTMEHLAGQFTVAFDRLLEGNSKIHVSPTVLHNKMDLLAAFQLLQDISPYVKFGHFTANQAILEAVAGDKGVHIVDYDISDGVQWAALMQPLTSHKGGPPIPRLRITALTRGGKRSNGTVHESGRWLAAFAESIGQPFSFRVCRVGSDESIRPETVKVVRGEALIFNCMLHLPHSRGPEQAAPFLKWAGEMGPRLVTLVEEEVSQTMGEQGFVGRFVDLLHHYSAVYDALEAGLGKGSAREVVERVIVGPTIAAKLERSYYGAEREGWLGRWMEEAGFGPVKISYFNHCQAKLLLGLFNGGYRVEEVSSNMLSLHWKSQRLLSASVWTAPPPSPLAHNVRRH